MPRSNRTREGRASSRADPPSSSPGTTGTRTFTVEFYRDAEAGGSTVLVPALPGCVTQGKDVAECLGRAKEAIAGYLECLRAEGKPIPVEDEPEGRIKVDVAA